MNWNENIITDKISKDIHEILTKREPVAILLRFFQETSETYNIDKISILKMYFNYLICREPSSVNSHVLNVMENVLHINDANIQTILKYVATNMFFLPQNIKN